MARILITGASGLIGSSLLPLFGPDDELHVVGRTMAPAFAQPNITFHQSDLGGVPDFRALPVELDGVVYLAQSENFRAFPDKAADIFAVNVANLLAMLDYARRAGAKSFVSASSGGVYGSARDPVTELAPTAAPGQLGFYLSSKLCGEVLAENYGSLMNIAILRPFFAYGSGQRRSMLLPRLVDNVRSGATISLQGPDGIRINPVHAKDAALAFKAALGLKGLSKINVAGPDALTLREICVLIGDRVGRAPVFSVQEDAPPADLVADIAALSALTGPPERRLIDHIGELA